MLQRDWPWRACLLSGGASQRMGRDKALLPHPQGGCWLERTLLLLAAQDLPVTLLSRHAEHRQRAEALALRHQLPIEALDEPPPWEGPLPALARLMAHHPHQRLLLCPVDMPGLTAAALQELRAAADAAADDAAGAIVVAHDGERLQPLLGVYPSGEPLRRHLENALAGGERRLQRWLEQQPHQSVQLPREMLRNINHPADWELFRTRQP
ncbi:MAG: molybdenum cofactor guanylyltransferase [Synechococcaceae cyanobacterium]|nr:molybdenum cofactor guanylyltransferase [Synechococcaceae cyanobacterium]